MTRIVKPRVTLLSITAAPMETLYAIWQTSNSGKLMTPKQVEQEVPAEKVLEFFRRIIEEAIPVSSMVGMVFAFEGVSVSWREQAVRHRIGTSWDDKLGVDIIPDLPSSAWWIQSSRVKDMSNFADEGLFRIPQSVEKLGCQSPALGKPELYGKYLEHMRQTQELYAELARAGVPLEDAREVLPIGVQHTVCWYMTLMTVRYIIGKRSCWCVQSGLWSDIISGIVAELAEKVHPMFRALMTPPCIRRDHFQECILELFNKEGLELGKDKCIHPPCPLWIQRNCLDQKGEICTWQGFLEKLELYEDKWGRNPWTGEWKK